MDELSLSEVALAVARNDSLPRAASSVFRRFIDVIPGFSEASTESRLVQVELDALRETLAMVAANPYLFIESATVGNIILKARPVMGGSLERLDDVDFGWWRNWRDKARLSADEEVENLFAQVLAGQVERPGAFSLQTLSVLGNLEKMGADFFAALCRFVVTEHFTEGDTEFQWVYPLFLAKYSDAAYRHFGYGGGALEYLDSLGLIRYVMDGMVRFISAKPGCTFSYFNNSYTFDSEVRLGQGCVDFTRAGLELYSLVSPEEVPGFWDFVLKCWKLA